MRNLPGWMSIKSPSEQTRWREGGRERVQGSTVHFAKARWRGQLWRLHAPSACQATACTQHADAITSACLDSSGQSKELHVLFPHLTFSFFFSQSAAGIEGEFVRRSNQISCLSGFDQRLFMRPGRSAQAVLAANREGKKSC